MERPVPEEIIREINKVGENAKISETNKALNSFREIYRDMILNNNSERQKEIDALLDGLESRNLLTHDLENQIQNIESEIINLSDSTESKAA